MPDSSTRLNVALDLLNDLAETVAADPKGGPKVVEGFWKKMASARKRNPGHGPVGVDEIQPDDWRRLEEAKQALVDIKTSGDLSQLAERVVQELRGAPETESWKPVAYRMLLTAIMNRIAAQESRRSLDPAARAAREKILSYRRPSSA